MISRIFRVRCGFIIIAAASLLGCTSGGVQDDAGNEVNDVYGAFSRGEVRLRCGAGCAFAWGAHSDNIKNLYQNQLWRDLALEVSNVNFQSDISYFYLGRAAEGLGAKEAASQYYRLSTASTYKCSGNNCRQINVPVEVAAGLKRVDPSYSKDNSSHSIDNSSDAAQNQNYTSTTKQQSNTPPAPKIDTAGVTVKYDEFDKSTTYIGKIIRSNETRAGGYNLVLSGLLATKSSSTANMQYVLVTSSSYEGKKYRNYNWAIDSSGERLSFLTNSHDHNCERYTCFLRETISIVFTRENLENRSKTGLRMRLEGMNGNQIVDIPPQYIESFLASTPK